MAGFGRQDFAALLAEARTRPSYAVYQRVGRKVRERLTDDVRAAAGPRTVRAAVLSSFTIDPLRAYLQVDLLERDVLPNLYIAGFNQFAQELRQPSSALYAFDPHVCFLHVEASALVPGLPHVALQDKDVDAVAAAAEDLMRTFRSHCRGDLVVSNFAAPVRFPYGVREDPAAEAFRELNRRLRRAAEALTGVHVLDFDRLAAFHGKGALADARLRHIARMELSGAFLPKLAGAMLGFVLALRGFGRKCVVLDLDDTLWGGVVGEDGPDGIRLGAEYPGSAFVEFQQALRTLRDRGILLAVNSKNNEADALEILERHSGMVLRPDSFAALRINWRDKCENIESIAAELNLGLDALAFIDDSPVERELMRRLRPEVLTPEWPADAVLFSAALESLPDFETVVVTTEDASRADIYGTEKRRQSLQERSATYEDYLTSLGIEIEVGEASEYELPRVAQLIQKTNQFNLTTRRYSLAEVSELHRDARAAVYVLKNWDAFGDNGLVGVAIVRKDGLASGATWTIDSLLMSCRVLGRTIEQGFLDFIVAEARASGAARVVGEFLPTPKNEQVNTFYGDAGFRRVDRGETARRWIAETAAHVPRHTPWLRLKVRAAAR